ncbi:MAG: InlB B-repeat-containing protein [Lachnospiraceae bacterium]|nr:InlB B-repeat-containing protein [Lachnospiraceae bacterium]
MRKKNTLFKRVFSSFMAVVIAFTTASYDAYAEELTTGEPSGYEYDESYAYGDVSGDEHAADISDNEFVVDISGGEDSADVSDNETIADVSPNEQDDTAEPEAPEAGDVSDNAEDTTMPDVSADDVSASDTEPVESIMPDWFVPGYVPNPFDDTAEEIRQRSGILRAAPLEERYIPDIKISLRNQNPYGTCWAFASTALAELYMNKHYGLTPDYSELHLAYFCYRPVIDPLGGLDGDISDSSWNFLNGGGNAEFAGFTFASWRGVATEKNVPYSRASDAKNNGIDADFAYDDAIHLRNFYEINIHKNPEIVKKLVKENGGVAISYYSADGYSPVTNARVYNSNNNCYYNPDAHTSNHAVTIVGWDDNFSKNNFSVAPATDGAWLIRNSWTTGSYANSQDYSGYFWMSYCDKSISDAAYSFTFDDAELYDNNYQYDGVPLNSWYTYSIAPKTITLANVFTAKACSAGEMLKAVSFHSASANFTAEIKIYKPGDSEKPNSGTAITSQTFSSDYPGYHTVELNEPVSLNPNEKFSVVIKLTAKGGVKVSCEQAYAFYGYTTHADAGESFVSYDNGKSWDDFGAFHNGNLRIKAFTCNNVDGIDVTSIEFKGDISSTGLTLRVLDEYNVKAVTRPFQISNSKLSWTSSNENVATVSETGCIKAVGLGTAVITATAPSGASCSVTVSVPDVASIEFKNNISSTGLTLELFGEYSVKTITKPFQVDNSELTWTSSDENVATVSEEGYIKAVGLGTAVITATASSGVDCSVTVSVSKIPNLLISYNGATDFERGTTRQYTVKVYTKNWEDITDKVTFSVSDTSILAVDEFGLVTALKPGSATLYVTLLTKTESVTVSVVPVIPQATISVSRDNTVTVTWPSTGADEYEFAFYDGSGRRAIIIPAVPGQEMYSYTDTYYCGTTKKRSVGYYVRAREYTDTNKYYMSQMIPQAYVGPTYDVTYVLNGGTQNPDNPEYIREGNYKLKSPTPPVGYKFVGWFTTETFDQETKIDTLKEVKEYTLYAQYDPIQYIVQFDGNGATSGSENGYVLTYDTDWTIPLNSERFKFARTDYMFTGWNTKADGTGKSYKDGDTVKNLTAEADDTVWLYAQWGEIKYEITFDAAGGTAVDTVKKLTHNSQYGTLPTTTREGYDFVGWYSAATGGYKVVEVMPFTEKKNQKLFARWTPKSYRLSFADPEGHTEVPSLSVTYTAAYGALPHPGRTGYDFAGWYLGDTLITATSKVNTIGDHTLTAHWNPKTIKVTFNGNGGTASPSFMNVEYDARYGKNGALPVPTRTNYTFAGWYTAAAGGNEITGSTVVNTEMAHTLYAHWKGVESTVSFDLRCDTSEIKPSSPEINDIKVEYQKTYGEALNADDTPAGGLKTPERVGYTFVGWFTSPDYTTQVTDASVVNITQDTTLYAQWEASFVDVTFVPENGENSTTESLVYGGPYELPETPLKRGYSFAGWYTKAYDATHPEDKGELKGESTIVTTPDAHTLYGHWNANEYIIRFVGEDDTQIGAIEVTFDAPVSGAIPAPEKAGYVFAGWSLSGDADDVINIGAKYDYDRDITLKACFVPRTDIEVTFDPAGGTLTETKWPQVTYKTTYESDGRVLPVPAKEHFEFAGWYTKPEGEDGAVRIYSDSIVNIGENHTLYAHWALKKYNVIFKLEGGNFYKKVSDTGETAALETLLCKVAYNTTLDITVPDPVRPKFSFAGWYDDPVGGSEFDFNAPITEDTYIYAHWTLTDENVDIGGNKYEAAVPTAEIHRQPGDTTTGDTFASNARIELKSATPGAKIYFMVNPVGEDVTADYLSYLNDKDKQNRLNLYTDELVPYYVAAEDGAIRIRAIAVKDGYTASAPVVFEFTLTDSNEEWGDITDDDKINRFEGDIAKVPEGMWISGVPQSVTYTGANITFADLKVYDGKRVLTLGTDYAVTYKNNKNAGAATITVAGKGNYAGNFTQNFTISPKNLADADITAQNVKLAFNGKIQLAAPVIKHGTIALKSGSDFTVLYPHTNAKEKDGANAYDADAFKASGDYEVTVTGKGNYTGTITYTETILTNGVKSVATLAVSGVPAKTAYTGAAVEPAVTVKNGAAILKGISASAYNALSPADKEEYDYTVEYFDNIAVGKARVIIKGVGSLYAGEKEIAFEITGTNISSAKVTAFTASYQYNGLEILPAVGGTDGINLYYDATKTAARKDLVYNAAAPDSEDNDYFVTYNSNVKTAGAGSAVGKATIVITGNPKKGYIGTKTLTYSITAVNLANDAKSDNQLIVVRDGGSDADFTDPAAHVYAYTKGGVTPKPEVSFVNGNGDKIKLTEGVDYTLAYANNTAINAGTDAKKLPTIKITGKGNFTGLRAVDYFVIEGADFASGTLKVTAADVSFANKKSNYLTAVIIKDANGKVLAANADYDKNFEYKLAEEVQFADGKIYPAGYVLTKNDIVPAGTRIKVTVTAKGLYAGSISTEYRVVGADISKAAVTIANQYFTGYEIRPDKSKLNVVINKISLSPEDYEITGYDNNINKGTGHIYIKGVGNYGGTKTVNFNIVNKPMGYTVVFNGNGSTSGAMGAQTIAAGKQAPLTANKFARTGFTFAGWTTEPNGTGNAYADKEIVSNPGTGNAIVLNLYAKWVPTEYTITYHMGGGTNNPLNTECPSEGAKTRYGKKDGKIYYTAATASFKLEAPLREDWPLGYQFEGFYKENTYKTRIAAINRGTTGNIDAYAKWVPYSYTVVFNGNGAEKGAMDNEAFSYGITKAVNANKFAKTGFVFMGWALSKEQADAQVAAIADKAVVNEKAFGLELRNNVSGKITLYAVWRRVFTVEFFTEGGTLPATTEADTGLMGIPQMPDSGKTYEYVFGTAYKLPTPVRAGYAFAGWFTDTTFKTKFTGIAKNKSGDIVLYAKWTPYKYTVAFNGNGSNGGKTANKAFNCGTPGTLNANGYTRKGFEFVKWNTAPDGSGTDYKDLAVIDIVPEKNNQTVTLYAQWAAVTYKIKYVRNGGNLTLETPNYISTYEFNHVAPGDTKGGYELPIPTRRGFTFLGWYKDAAFRTKVARINKGDFGDITLYAKWGMKYKVSFDAGVSEGGSGVMADQVCAYETATALRGNSFKSTNGKVFMGWAVSAAEAEAGNVTFTNGQKLLTPDVSLMKLNDVTGMYEMTLYAVWRSKFTVEFNTNGGELPNHAEIVKTTGFTYLSGNRYEYKYGTAYTLPTPTREGFTFAGWFEDAAFKKKAANIAKTTSGDKVLYAKFTGMKYNVTFNSDAPLDAAGLAKRKVSGSTGAQSLVYMTPAKLKTNGFKIPGYTFLGWSTRNYEARVEAYKNATGETDTAVARLAYDLDPSADVEYTNAESIEDILLTGETTPAYEAGYVLYAVWQKDVYVITYQNVGGLANSNSITYTVDDEVVLADVEKMGDTFLGWYADAGLKSKVVKIAKGSTGNRSLYAKFANNKYTINYVLNDADGSAAILDSSQVGYITTYDMSADSGYLLADATREGYDFAGWYTDAKLTKPAGPIIAAPSVEMTVYAKWIKKND